MFARQQSSWRRRAPRWPASRGSDRFQQRARGVLQMASAVKMTPNWREQIGAKLITPEEAVAHIKSGDRITASIAQATPFTLFHALAGRLMEIERVVVN